MKLVWLILIPRMDGSAPDPLGWAPGGDPRYFLTEESARAEADRLNDEGACKLWRVYPAALTLLGGGRLDRRGDVGG